MVNDKLYEKCICSTNYSFSINVGTNEGLIIYSSMSKQIMNDRQMYSEFQFIYTTFFYGNFLFIELCEHDTSIFHAYFYNYFNSC